MNVEEPDDLLEEIELGHSVQDLQRPMISEISKTPKVTHPSSLPDETREGRGNRRGTWFQQRKPLFG